MLTLHQCKPVKITLTFPKQEMISTFNAFSTDADVVEVSPVTQINWNTFQFHITAQPDSEWVCAIIAEAYEPESDNMLRWFCPVSTMSMAQQDAEAVIESIEGHKTRIDTTGHFTTDNGLKLTMDKDSLSLMQSVCEMRDNQKNYFKEKDPELKKGYLIASKQSEKLVDENLKKLKLNTIYEQPLF